MAMRAAAKVAAAGPCGLRGFFSTLSSTFPFIPPPTNQPERPQAEPSTNLFVSGTFLFLDFWLSKRTTTEGLSEAFAKFGEVVNARVVTDRINGFSKGFGFVRYATVEEAAEGIKGMDGKFLDGWVIFAEYARPRPPLPDNNAGPTPRSSPYGSPYGRQ
ncbi:RNA-binding (RRM/RBD/RNP motifs) family protein [Actinidia rufa]|uniref:RNA-binding (RRM/RBD/RNP motifs) family protein n=1 Tax=Actinidia rufa TaxID=165716 RepID=A0A7J0G9I6_9ERIC|nr:RNA-binding (RRM/RBD/RNP motifs) family protein [Actinidia rufa]